MVELGLEGYVHYVVVLVVVGVIGGYVAGLFGIGGGVVLVPAFVTVLPHFGTSLHVLMHSAVGTCLALIVPGAVMSARKQYRQGNLDLSLLRSWLPPITVGIVAGVLLMRGFPTVVLKMLFTGFLLAATVYALVGKRSPAGKEGIPRRGPRTVGGILIGGLSVMLGIGGGTLAVPFYRFYDYPLKRAIALSSATGGVIGLGGAIGAIATGWGVSGRPPHSLGYVDVVAFAILTPCMMIFSPLGSKTGNALPENVLNRLYVGFLGAMTAYMAYQTYRDF